MFLVSKKIGNTQYGLTASQIRTAVYFKWPQLFCPATTCSPGFIKGMSPQTFTTPQCFCILKSLCAITPPSKNLSYLQIFTHISDCSTEDRLFHREMLCFRHGRKLAANTGLRTQLSTTRLYSGPSLLLYPKLADLDTRDFSLLAYTAHT